MSRSELSLNIFTLNCWAIPYISENRIERIDAIAKFLCKKNYDAVCLQELWSNRDYTHIKNEVKAVLPYAYYFYSGVTGSGLCIFSKWQIVDAFFHQWSLNGYIHKLHHGDWFGGKGIGLCKIKWNDRIVNIYCTHFHAEYNENYDIYLAHRLTQAYSAASFVNLTTAESEISVLAGDLNSTPGDISYRLITELTHVVDPFDLECERSNPEVRRSAGTNETAENSYTPARQAQKLPAGKRIDHILFSVKPGWEVKVMNFGDPLPERVPGHKFSYSDHSAVALELSLKNEPDMNFKNPYKVYYTQNSAISQAYNICDSAIAALDRSRKFFLLFAGFILMLLLGTAGYWPSHILFDLLKIVFTGTSLYFFFLGTLWHRIEVNSLKECSDGLRLKEQSFKSKVNGFNT